MFLRVTFFLSILLLSTLWAQEAYQKAKVPLDAKAAINIAIWASPNVSSTQIMSLTKDTLCAVVGKQGAWYEVNLNNRLGWVPTQALLILGPSSAQTSPPQADSRSESPARKKSTASISRNLKTSSWMVSSSYAKGLKSIENSFRAGAHYSFISFQRTSLHMMAGAALQSEKLIYLGPGFQHDLGFRFVGGRAVLLTSIPMYYFSDSITANASFAVGTQVGPQLHFGSRTKLSFGLSLESILFGATKTRVSLMPTIGLVF